MYNLPDGDFSGQLRIRAAQLAAHASGGIWTPFFIKNWNILPCSCAELCMPLSLERDLEKNLPISLRDIDT